MYSFKSLLKTSVFWATLLKTSAFRNSMTDTPVAIPWQVTLAHFPYQFYHQKPLLSKIDVM
jgi:hypothetical protein